MICENEFIELYCSASPEVQKAIQKLLELQEPDLDKEVIRNILIDCGVDKTTMARFYQ